MLIVIGYFSLVFVFSKKGGKVKTEYKHEYVHTNLDLDLSSLNVFGSAVVGYAFPPYEIDLTYQVFNNNFNMICMAS